MRRIFADSFFYIALMNSRDKYHDRAKRWATQQSFLVVTTHWVLTEVADALAAPHLREQFVILRTDLREDFETHVIPATVEWFDAGCNLYEQRPDKYWSLTDCISFEVMRRYGVTEALTADHHFEQAGFIALLNQEAS